MPLVFLSDGDDEPEVRPHELVQRVVLALLDTLREVHLLLRLQKRDLPNLLEVLVQHALLARDVHSGVRVKG